MLKFYGVLRWSYESNPFPSIFNFQKLQIPKLISLFLLPLTQKPSPTSDLLSATTLLLYFLHICLSSLLSTLSTIPAARLQWVNLTKTPLYHSNKPQRAPTNTKYHHDAIRHPLLFLFLSEPITKMFFLINWVFHTNNDFS